MENLFLPYTAGWQDFIQKSKIRYYAVVAKKNILACLNACMSIPHLRRSTTAVGPGSQPPMICQVIGCKYYDRLARKFLCKINIRREAPENFLLFNIVG